MRVIVAALCDHAAPGQNDKLNINGIFDIIWAEKFPTTHHHAYLALRLLFEYEDRNKKHTVEVVIENQDRALARFEAEVEIGAIPPGVRIPVNHIFEFQQLVFERPDKFSIAILWDGEERQRIPLDVALQTKK